MYRNTYLVFLLVYGKMSGVKASEVSFKWFFEGSAVGGF